MDNGALGQVPALTGIRGLAILLILVLHSGYGNYFLGGGLGVDVFFVLSGFLITTLLLEEWEATDGLDLGSFYVRRVLRLYPALLVTVALAAIFYTQLPGHSWHAFWVAALGALFYAANFLVSFSAGHGATMDGMGHLWTLALEEQFYLVWPIVLLLALNTGRRWLPVVIATVGLGASWLSLYLYQGPFIGGIPQNYFRPDSRAGGLLVGCIAALLLRHDWAKMLARNRLLGYAAAFGLAVTVGVAGHGRGRVHEGVRAPRVDRNGRRDRCRRLSARRASGASPGVETAVAARPHQLRGVRLLGHLQLDCRTAYGRVVEVGGRGDHHCRRPRDRHPELQVHRKADPTVRA